MNISDLPKLPQGSIIIPPSPMKNLEDVNKNEEIRKQYSHDWKIAIFNTFAGAIAGGIMGLITSIIFWLITK